MIVSPWLRFWEGEQWSGPERKSSCTSQRCSGATVISHLHHSMGASDQASCKGLLLHLPFPETLDVTLQKTNINFEIPSQSTSGFLQKKLKGSADERNNKPDILTGDRTSVS